MDLISPFSSCYDNMFPAPLLFAGDMPGTSSISQLTIFSRQGILFNDDSPSDIQIANFEQQMCTSEDNVSFFEKPQLILDDNLNGFREDTDPFHGQQTATCSSVTTLATKPSALPSPQINVPQSSIQFPQIMPSKRQNARGKKANNKLSPQDFAFVQQQMQRQTQQLQMQQQQQQQQPPPPMANSPSDSTAGNDENEDNESIIGPNMVINSLMLSNNLISFEEAYHDHSLYLSPTELHFLPASFWSSQPKKILFSALVDMYFKRQRTKNSTFVLKLYNLLLISQNIPRLERATGVRWVNRYILEVSRLGLLNIFNVRENTVDGSMFHRQGNFPTHHFIEINESNFVAYNFYDYLKINKAHGDTRFFIHTKKLFTKRTLLQMDIDLVRYVNEAKKSYKQKNSDRSMEDTANCSQQQSSPQTQQMSPLMSPLMLPQMQQISPQMQQMPMYLELNEGATTELPQGECDCQQQMEAADEMLPKKSKMSTGRPRGRPRKNANENTPSTSPF